MKSATFILWAIGITCCALLPLNARRMIVLSYQQLLDRSDLVVIATPITRTRDTTESSYLPNILRQDATGAQSQIASIGVETEFKISTVLKGEKSIQAFVLHHYREAVQEDTADGLFLVFFDPMDFSKRSSYLLFLVREPGGRYAPTGPVSTPSLRSRWTSVQSPRSTNLNPYRGRRNGGTESTPERLRLGGPVSVAPQIIPGPRSIGAKVAAVQFRVGDPTGTAFGIDICAKFRFGASSL